MEKMRERRHAMPQRPLSEAEKDERARQGGSMMAMVMIAAMAFMCLCEAGVLP